MPDPTDLIRRGDAIAAIPNGWLGQPYFSNMDYGPNVSVQAIASIRALPAQEPPSPAAESNRQDIIDYVRTFTPDALPCDGEMGFDVSPYCDPTPMPIDQEDVFQPGKEVHDVHDRVEPPSPGVTAGETMIDGADLMHDPGVGIEAGATGAMTSGNSGQHVSTPAPVVPAEGLDPEHLVSAWLSETEGFATRHERLMDDILAECDLAPWLHAACQVGIDAALRSSPPVGARVGPLAAIFDAAEAEAEKAMRKFPQPNYVISKVAEEAGEVVKAAIHCAEGRDTRENVIGEIKQCIAMLIRLYLEGDQVHGLPALTPNTAQEGG